MFGRKDKDEGKAAAVQDAVNAAAVATQVINDYGVAAAEAVSATHGVLDAVVAARAAGATDDELRAARPQ
ncbi:hypothetical protein GCM10010232_65910 [Streptomyces amakusaensis]|uniref:Uncharacterized protein n=1 Tax=Streptomyces amakusaensis TaxID=67271 RepID=A0ABW0AUP3_9ACTN